MLEGLLVALTPMNLLLMAIAVAGGIVIGALPGLTATLGTALLLPFTFAMDPASGLIMLGGLYIGAMMGDATPAILVDIPGTPSGVATAFDGYQMNLQGRAHQALIAAAFSAAVGSFIGGVALLLIAPPLATAALAFGPPEFFWLGVFALTIMGAIAGKSIVRGLAGGLIGLMLGTVGIAASGGTTRFTFGFPELLGGISLPVALIGLFAIPQLISLVQDRREKTTVASGPKSRGRRGEFKEMARPVPLLRSGVIGTFIGILPGAGASLASLVSYNEAVRWSRRSRGMFGKGAVEGVISSETAGNAAAPASMVPLLTLGIPGSNVAAITMGALLFHGLQPGPALFRDTPEVVYGYMWAMVIGGLFVFVIGRMITPVLVQAMQLPVTYLIPVIASLTVIGGFAIRNRVFDVWIMLIIGLVGCVATWLKVPLATIALGLILGPIVEKGLVTSMSMTESHGFMDVFVMRPISALLIVLTIVSAVSVVYSRRSPAMKEEAMESV